MKAVGITFGILGAITSVEAALIDLGNGLVEDTTLNITWMKDANMVKTSCDANDALWQAFDPLTVPNNSARDKPTICSHNGILNWYEAEAWIAVLNTQNYLGYNDWRQPTTNPVDGAVYDYNFAYDGSTDFGYNISGSDSVYPGSTSSELAHMHYDSLGNGSYYDPDGNNQKAAVCPAPDYCVQNTGPFYNHQPNTYWSGTETAPGSSFALLFSTRSGYQAYDYKVYEELDFSHLYVWPVRSSSSFCNSPELAIADNDAGGVVDALHIPVTHNLSDLDLWLQIDHTNVSDLTVELVDSDIGTAVTVLDQPVCPDANVSAVFDDDGSVIGCSGTPSAIANVVQPVGSLADFNGANLLGDWELHMADLSVGDTGKIRQWCLLPNIADTEGCNGASASLLGQHVPEPRQLTCNTQSFNAQTVYVAGDLSVHYTDTVAINGPFVVQEGGTLSLGENTVPVFSGPTSLEGDIGDSVNFVEAGIVCNDTEEGSIAYAPASTGALEGPPGIENFTLTCTDGSGLSDGYSVDVDKDCAPGTGWNSGSNSCVY